MPYEKIKRLFRVMPWLLALVLTGVFVVLLHYEWRQQDNLWRERLGLGVEMLAVQVDINRWHLTRQAVQGAELIAANPQILATIRAAYAVHQDDPNESSADMASIRAELERQLQPYWRDLKALNARYLQVSLAQEATVLLRMHRPERFGDRLMHLRPLVMDVFSSGECRQFTHCGHRSRDRFTGSPTPCRRFRARHLISAGDIQYRIVGQGAC